MLYKLHLYTFFFHLLFIQPDGFSRTLCCGSSEYVLWPHAQIQKLEKNLKEKENDFERLLKHRESVEESAREYLKESEVQEMRKTQTKNLIGKMIYDASQKVKHAEEIKIKAENDLKEVKDERDAIESKHAPLQEQSEDAAEQVSGLNPTRMHDMYLRYSQMQHTFVCAHKPEQ